MGGTLEACCLQPIDVIKTRLQLDKTGKYRGIVDCGRTVAAEEGVRALWKGLTPFATHLTLKYALRMGSNSVYQVGIPQGILRSWQECSYNHGGAHCALLLMMMVRQVNTHLCVAACTAAAAAAGAAARWRWPAL